MRGAKLLRLVIIDPVQARENGAREGWEVCAVLEASVEHHPEVEDALTLSLLHDTTVDLRHRMEINKLRTFGLQDMGVLLSSSIKVLRHDIEGDLVLAGGGDRNESMHCESLEIDHALEVVVDPLDAIFNIWNLEGDG